MACVLPPELDNKTLLIFIDDKADHHVAAHLEQCPHCREKAHRLTRLNDYLSAQLYRLTCPPPITLGEYHLGVLLRDQMASIARHLVECPHCSREIAQLRDYMAKPIPTPEPTPLKSIKILVAQLVYGGGGGVWAGSSGLSPGYAGLRGEEQGLYLYQANDVQIAVEVQDDAGQQGHKALLGLVTGMDTHELSAHLWQIKQRVATTLVDDLGNFVIPNLAPGNYKLILSGPEEEVHVREMEI